MTAANNFGFTALHVASLNDSAEMVRFLLDWEFAGP